MSNSNFYLRGGGFLKLLLLMAFLIASEKAVAQQAFSGIQGPRAVCPNTTHTYTWSGTGWVFTTVFDPVGTPTFEVKQNQSFNLTFTNEGIYRIRVQYVPWPLVWLKWILGEDFKPYRSDFLVNVRFKEPYPDAEKLIYCGGNETQTVNITGLDNVAEDCFYTGNYTYEAPAGWTLTPPGNSNRLINSPIESVQLTTPPNVANGDYELKVSTTVGTIRTSIIPIRVGTPDAPSGNITSQYGSLCVGDEVTIDLPSGNFEEDYEWTVTGVASVVSTFKRSIRVICNSAGSFTVSINSKNDCGSSSSISQTFSVSSCGGVFPGGRDFTGLSPFPPSGNPEEWTTFSPELMGLSLDHDVHGGFDVVFLETLSSPSPGDTMIIRDHDLGMDYSIKLTNLDNGSVDYNQTHNTQAVYIDAANLDLTSYVVEIKNGNAVSLDTVMISSRCTGNCFKGISPISGNLVDMSPVFSPNPSGGSGTLTISFYEDPNISPTPGHNIGFTYDVKIYDQLGVVRRSFTGLNLQEVSVSIGTLPNGTYIARVESAMNIYSSVWIKN